MTRTMRPGWLLALDALRYATMVTAAMLVILVVLPAVLYAAGTQVPIGR